MITPRISLLRLWMFLIFLTPLFLQAQDRDKIVWVEKTLGNIPFERRSLLEDYGGFGSSVLVRSAGEYDKALPVFVVAVPLNAEFAVNTALSMAEKLHSGNNSGVNTANILIAFLGDEENVLLEDMGGFSHKGLRDLLTLADTSENCILCYIDIDEEPEKLVIRHGISGYVAPLNIVRPLPQIFKERDIPWNFRIRHSEIYKLGLVEGPKALFIAWDSEINGFVLSGSAKRNQVSISADNLSQCLLDYAGLLTISTIHEDRHYSYFNIPWIRTIFISEGLTVAFILIAAGLCLFHFLFSSARFHVALLFDIRQFFRLSWLVLILLPLMVISVKFSGSLYSFLLGLLSAGEKLANNTGAGLSVLLAGLIFFLPSPALDFIHFPRRAQFYGVSAVFFIAIGFFFAASLDFSYVRVFLWAFIFIFIGSQVKDPVAVFICVLMIPIFAVDAVINIIETNSNTFAELFINYGWKAPETWMAATITALFILPFSMLIRRGTILVQELKHRKARPKPNRKYRLILIPALIVSVLLIMVVQILLLHEKPAPERRIYNVEDRQGIRLVSKTVIFQDSRIITLLIEAEEIPVRFDVFIESKNDASLQPVYSASVPFTREDGGKRVNFSLGENPPNPLTIEIVLPLEFEGALIAAAVYNNWNPVLDPGTEPKTSDYVLKLTKKIDLELTI